MNPYGQYPPGQYPPGMPPVGMPGTPYPVPGPAGSHVYPAGYQQPYPGMPGQQFYPPGVVPGQYPPGIPGQAYPGYPQPGQPGYVPVVQQIPGVYPMQVPGVMPNVAACGTVAVVPCEPDEPTVRGKPQLNAEEDAKCLNKAMKGLGTDEKAIIEILTNRTCAQRLYIAQTYKTMFGKDLIHQLKKELSGNFEDAVVALLEAPEVYDAHSLHDAVCGLGTKEQTLIEIICSRTNAELFAIKQAYKFLYKKDLESDIASDTSGEFKRILIACLMGNRDEGYMVDIEKAKYDAKALYEAGPKRWGTDEATFISIFSVRSFAQLRVTFEEFKHVAKHDIEHVIKNEMSGYMEESFLALAQICKNKHAYFAERLHHSMEGAGTHDKVLIRLIVSRCEKDLGNIKKQFLAKYKKTLESFITHDCSGDYKKILLALVNYGSR